jgi:hypothetical protein
VNASFEAYPASTATSRTLIRLVTKRYAPRSSSTRRRKRAGLTAETDGQARVALVAGATRGAGHAIAIELARTGLFPPARFSDEHR